MSGAGAATATAPQKFLTPARADGINDAAVFGAGAREVSIFDLRGTRVFRGSRDPAGPPIVWNARDRTGRLVPSGTYIARIVDVDGRRVLQRLVVVK
jgi:hypothetical protein